MNSRDNHVFRSIFDKNYDKGGIYGLLIGDALGVPYEFHMKEDIPPLEKIEMTPPDGFVSLWR